jgi:hypothetical protein
MDGQESSRQTDEMEMSGQTSAADAMTGATMTVTQDAITAAAAAAETSKRPRTTTAASSEEGEGEEEGEEGETGNEIGDGSHNDNINSSSNSKSKSKTGRKHGENKPWDNIEDSYSAAAERLFSSLRLAPFAPLESVQARGRCPVCKASRKRFCYDCFVTVDCPPNALPHVKLPLKLDVVKDIRETNGKATSIHARMLAPDDVTIYTPDTMPAYTDEDQAVSRASIVIS